jgi:hypothetical protein
VSSCRSCDAEIRWVMMADSGKMMPIDAHARDDGNVRLLGSIDGPSGLPLASYIRAGEVVSGQHRFVSHFATCVNADAHRTDRQRAQRTARRRGVAF